MARFLLIIVLIFVLVPATAICVNRAARSFYHTVLEEQKKIDATNPEGETARP